MIKTVNVNARIPIRNVVPPIHGYHAGLEMHTEDILKCLTRRAIVHEVLSDGKLVQLNMRNYCINNEPVTKAVEVKEETRTIVLSDNITVEDSIEEIKTETTVEEVEPVTETPVEEVEPVTETPVDEVEPVTETPVEETEQATETPAEETEQATETPAEEVETEVDTTEEKVVNHNQNRQSGRNKKGPRR